MDIDVKKEIERFSKIWETSKQVNPNGFNVILTVFMTTVNPDIVPEVELKIREKYNG